MQGVSYIDAEIRSGRIRYGLAIGRMLLRLSGWTPWNTLPERVPGLSCWGKAILIASIEDIAPYSSLFMDFWRREESAVPKHFGRTTVEAYKSHIIGAIANLFRKHPDLSLSDFDWITFHQPSGYLPMKNLQRSHPGRDPVRRRFVHR